MDIEKIKECFLIESPDEIYNNYFISGEIWIFKNLYKDKWFLHYDNFKKYISNKLNVHYNDIGIAGSAKLGFSINPSKNFKKFDTNSDVDIIIVSKNLFERFWQEYLSDSYNPTAQINNIHKIAFGIFRKYLFLDGFRNNEYYNDWKKKTMSFEKDIQLLFNIDNQIHYRIFESWDSVKYYYISSIESAKLALREEEI